MDAALEAAMLAAHRAGLSVIPLRSNKRPDLASWAERIDAQPDEMMVRLEARHHEGFAVAGGGPGRTQFLDFEAGFDGFYATLSERLEAAGLADTFTAWCEGYTVGTPGGGLHVAVHVEGEGTPPGNVKLAMDAGGHTLVETRGHGGYVVAAPSNGHTHPSGKPWVQLAGSFERIAWATEDEWNSVCAVIRTFDALGPASETPPPAFSLAQPGGVSLSRIEHTLSWIDGVQMPSMSMLLDNAGWSYHHADGEHTYWTRPGKDPREGHSATVNANDRLFVFSSNAHPVPMSAGKTTYDAVDVLGCYQLDHLPSLAERTEILRGFAGLSGQRVRGGARAPAEGAWLPDDFWEAREWLSAIRQAAWEAQRCPEAALGAVLSTYAVEIPSTIRIEALVGGNSSPLNTYVALVGPPGAGKSGAIATARKLCGAANSESYRYGLPLRSGEGLVTMARIPQPKRKADEVPLTPLYRSGIQVVFDEGNALASQNDRWHDGDLVAVHSMVGLEGATVGGSAGGEESFPADFVRVCLVLGIQFGVGNTLFTGAAAAQGFPARLAYFGMDNLGPREFRRRGTTSRLELPHYFPDPRNPCVLTFPTGIEEQVSVWDYERQRLGVDPLDGHKMLLRMRISGLLALMDSATQVESDHWALAGEIERHSTWTRSRVLSAIAEVATSTARAAGRMDAEREMAHHDAWLEDRARRLAQFVQAQGDQPVIWRRVKDRFNASDRKQLDAIVTYAIERNWIAYTEYEGKKALLPGKAACG
jgi:hypothetical protein